MSFLIEKIRELNRNLNEIWDLTETDKDKIQPGDIIYGSVFQVGSNINVKDNHRDRFFLVVYRSKDVFYGFSISAKCPKYPPLSDYVIPLKNWKSSLLAGPSTIYVNSLKNIHKNMTKKWAMKISKQDAEALLKKLLDIKQNPDKYPLWNGTEQENYLDRVIYAVEHFNLGRESSSTEDAMLWSVFMSPEDIEDYKEKHPDIKYEELNKN